MMIITKYDKGDLVWFMYDGKIFTSTVSRFRVMCEYAGGPLAYSGWGSNTYPIKISYSITVKNSDLWLEEENLFRRKQDLLDSL